MVPRRRHLLDMPWDNNVPAFFAGLLSNLFLSNGYGLPTFSRATKASVTDFEGLIRTAKSGEARFEGARRVENLLGYSEDLTNAIWVSYIKDVTRTPGIADPHGGNNAWELATTDSSGNCGVAQVGGVAGKTYTASAWLRAKTGTVIAQFGIGDSSQASLTLDTTWRRYSFTGVTDGSSRKLKLRITTASAVAIYAYHLQTEDVTGQVNQNPSEYVSNGVLTSEPYHGANVDGVKYFATENGNTVSSNVVTEATGSAIADATLHGYLSEGPRTNLALQSETLGTTWTPTNLTVTENSLASPRGDVTADTLTATNANATLLQSVTGTAASYTFSIYLKRKTGTGDVSISADGTNFTTCDLSGGGWVRYTDTRTLTVAGYNQTIKLATSGDEVYAWGAQLEAGGFASSYIPTTTASVTRNSDVLTYPISGNVSSDMGAIYVEGIMEGYASGITQNIIALSGNNNNRAHIRTDSGNGNSFGMFGTGTGYESIGNTPLTLNNRKYALAWVNGLKGRLFIDGVKKASTTNNVAVIPTIIDIGGDITAGRFYGTIRNVKIWKKALSDAQLLALTQ